MSSVMVTKETLRRVYLEKRQGMRDEEYDLRNSLLRKNFRCLLDESSIKTLHIFLPITSNKEVNTWPIIHDIRTDFPHVEVFTSKVKEGGTLSHYRLEESTRLVINKWGIPEPDDEQEVQLDQIDAVVVPLIISDKSGHRIGYGKGYYDRFLAETNVTYRIGVSLSPPLDCIPMIEAHDVPLTHCVSPYILEKF